MTEETEKLREEMRRLADAAQEAGRAAGDALPGDPSPLAEAAEEICAGIAGLSREERASLAPEIERTARELGAYISALQGEIEKAGASLSALDGHSAACAAYARIRDMGNDG
jgi:hypothetical protein